jgi:hypothetical protein
VIWRQERGIEGARESVKSAVFCEGGHFGSVAAKVKIFAAVKRSEQTGFFGRVLNTLVWICQQTILEGETKWLPSSTPIFPR